MAESQTGPTTDEKNKGFIPEPAKGGDYRRFIGWSSDAKNAEYSLQKLFDGAKATHWLWSPFVTFILGCIATSSVAILSVIGTIAYHTLDFIPAIVILCFLPILHRRMDRLSRSDKHPWELAAWVLYIFPVLWLFALMGFGYAIYSLSQVENVPFLKFWLLACVYGSVMTVVQVFWILIAVLGTILASFYMTSFMINVAVPPADAAWIKRTRKAEQTANSTEQAETPVNS